MSYTIFETKGKQDLSRLTCGKLDLQSILRFSQGTEQTKEELHYEDSPDPEVITYEILIPIGGPITLKISPVKVDMGTPELDAFEIVTVDVTQGVIIHPKTCHFVIQADRFLVLKTRGGWKYTRKAATPEGECTYQANCNTSHLCPHPDPL